MRLRQGTWTADDCGRLEMRGIRCSRKGPGTLGAACEVCRCIKQRLDYG